MIYFGYDRLRQITVAVYREARIVCGTCSKANEIVCRLYPGSRLIPGSSLIGVNGVESWMRFRPYSDQVWNDILSIAVR